MGGTLTRGKEEVTNKMNTENVQDINLAEAERV